MISIIAYFLTLFCLIIFLASVSFYLFSDIIANFIGGPYVPTKQKEIDIILKNANLKKGQVFYDLGSGDGRLVRAAVKKYKVYGFGIEINPLLIFYARIKAKMERIDNISFKRINFFNVNLKKADIIFIFLMPGPLKKLKEKFMAECKKNVLIISHGFRIQAWEKYLIKIIFHRPFPTYYYIYNRSKT
jgi:SAM-dependent methyltransferase